MQAEIPSLVKDEQNKHQNYKYFEESQLLKILKPLLKEKKLTMEITDDDTQPFSYEREGNKHFIRYLKKMEITDQESGQSKVYKFWACGDNTDLAKAKGSAETYATKYILSKFFLIRVVDDNDPELKKPEQQSAEQEKKTTLKCPKCGNSQLTYEPRIGKHYCGKCHPSGGSSLSEANWQ